MFVVVFAGTAMLLGCGGDDDAPDQTVALQQDEQLTPVVIPVAVEDNKFAPPNLTVPKGSRVRWEWDGKNSHSVTGTWDGTKIESPRQRDGEMEFTFATPGVFDYQCGVHGASMAGRITVKE